MKRITLGAAFACAALWSGGAAAACVAAEPDAALLGVVRDNSPAASEADGDQQHPARRRLIVSLIERLTRAGLGEQALAFALHKDGLNMAADGARPEERPAEVMAAIRTLRFVAGGFDGHDLGQSPSDFADRRILCLDQAETIASIVIDRISGAGGALERFSAEDAEDSSSLEAALQLLAAFHLERAEIHRDMGDLVFRSIDADRETRPRLKLLEDAAQSGKARLALTRYRDAQLDLATALAVADPDTGPKARIRIVSEEVNLRIGWLRDDRAFGGRRYDMPVRPIGYQTHDDPLGFTILKTLQTGLAELGAAQKARLEQKERSFAQLRSDFTNLAVLYAQGEAYKHGQLQTLFAELEKLGADTLDLRVDQARTAGGSGDEQARREEAAERERREFDLRIAAARDDLHASLPALSAQIAALAEFGPLDAPPAASTADRSAPPDSDPLWKEDSAIFGRIFGACGSSLTPPRIRFANALWAEEIRSPADWSFSRLNDLPAFLHGRIVEKLGPAAQEAASPLAGEIGRLRQAMTLLEGVAQADDPKTGAGSLEIARRGLFRKCWDLARQLQIERALLVNTRLDLDIAHLERLSALAQKETEVLAETILAKARDSGAEAVGEIAGALQTLQQKVLAATQGRVLAQIAKTKALLDEAQAIVDQVIKTGRGVADAAKAAKGVFSAFAGVPVGSGPGGVFLERDTLVAATNSAVEMAKFTYHATTDAMQIKAQLAEFEEKLDAYKRDLENLKLEQVGLDLENALKAAGDDIEKEVGRILKETREAVLGEIDVARTRVKQDLQATIESVVQVSDSQVGLIQQQLEGVFDDLRRMDGQSRALESRRLYALQEIQRALSGILAKAQAVQDVAEQARKAAELRAMSEAEAEQRQNELRQALASKDARIVNRAEEILAEIEAVRSGASANPWTEARAVAVSFFAPPPGLDLDALESNRAVQRALDKVGADLFELAVALKYLSQSDKPLLYAVQPASPYEAQRLEEALIALYRERIRFSLNLAPRVIALRITPETAALWGRAPAAEGEAEYPRCLSASREEAQAGQRCLRVVVSSSAQENWRWNEPGEERREARSPKCLRSTSIRRVLNPEGAPEGYDVEVLWPANAPPEGEAASGYCPHETPPAISAAPGRNGELVFLVDELMPQNTEFVLLDALMAAPSREALRAHLRPTNLTPVGPSRNVCNLGGGRLEERLIDLPFETLYESASPAIPRPSPTTLSPGDGTEQLVDTIRAINRRLPEELFGGGGGVAGRRSLFYGRGMANSFEIHLQKPAANQSPQLHEEIYVFLIVAPVTCQASGAALGLIDASNEKPYASEFDDLIALLSDAPQEAAPRLADAPTARALLRFERRIAAEDATRSGRLALLEQGLALGKALERPAGEGPLEQSARLAAGRHLQSYLSALPSAPEALTPASLENLFECSLNGVNCALSLRSFSGAQTADPGGPAAAEEQPALAAFKMSPVDRPLPIGLFTAIIDKLMRGPAGADGPLPREVERRMEQLNQIRDLHGRALEFLDRSVTTNRTMRRLEDLAEKRLDFLDDATKILKLSTQPAPDGLVEQICADRLLSDPGFWLLRRASGQLSADIRLLGQLRGFNAHCQYDDAVFDKAQCVALTEPALPLAAPEENDALAFDRECAMKLGLPDEAAAGAFARALAEARNAMSAAQ